MGVSVDIFAEVVGIRDRILHFVHKSVFGMNISGSDGGSAERTGTGEIHQFPVEHLHALFVGSGCGNVEACYMVGERTRYGGLVSQIHVLEGVVGRSPDSKCLRRLEHLSVAGGLYHLREEGKLRISLDLVEKRKPAFLPLTVGVMIVPGVGASAEEEKSSRQHAVVYVGFHFHDDYKINP